MQITGEKGIGNKLAKMPRCQVVIVCMVVVVLYGDENGWKAQVAKPDDERPEARRGREQEKVVGSKGMGPHRVGCFIRKEKTATGEEGRQEVHFQLCVLGVCESKESSLQKFVEKVVSQEKFGVQVQ